MLKIVLFFRGDYNFLNISKPAFRYFKDDDIKKADGAFGYIAVSTLLPEDIGRSEDGTKEINELFGNKIFNFPKPVNLIKYLVKIVTAFDKKAIILDFFSGSSTTAQAVMQLNAEDEGNRIFIMTQLPEKCEEKSEAYKTNLKTICEIGKERIRRAGKKIKEEAGLNAENLDVGFKVFRLSQSNFKEVTSYEGSNVNEIPDWFAGDPLIEGWKAENLLCEVMLKEVFPLDSAIIELKEYKKNKIYSVSSDFCGHSLVVCFDTNIDNDTIEKLDLGQSNIFICLDSAITDQAKSRLDDKEGRLVVI
jgi:adenine-specific DNA-methyltransferase